MFRRGILVTVPHLSEPLFPHLCRKAVEEWDCSGGSEVESPGLWRLLASPKLRGTHKLAGNWGGRGFPVSCVSLTGGPLVPAQAESGWREDRRTPSRATYLFTWGAFHAACLPVTLGS